MKSKCIVLPLRQSIELAETVATGNLTTRTVVIGSDEPARATPWRWLWQRGRPLPAGSDSRRIFESFSWSALWPCQ
jgi:hypothetical protein